MNTCSAYYADLWSCLRRNQKLTARKQRRSPNITAVVANTKGKNTSIAASTKNTNTPQTKTRSANGDIATNIGNTSAKRARRPLVPASFPPLVEKLNPLLPLEIQVWMTGHCWRTWRNRGP